MGAMTQAQIANSLRDLTIKQQMIDRLRGHQAAYDTMAAAPALSSTSGGSFSIGGRQFQMPETVQYNRGAGIANVIGQAMGGYNQGKMMEANDALNTSRQQMQLDYLRGMGGPKVSGGVEQPSASPVANAAEQNFYASQLGIPGAEAALAEQFNPKNKNAIGLLQNIHNMSPEAIQMFGQLYGLDPEALKSVAQGQKRMMDEEFKQELEKERVRASLRNSLRGSTKLSFEEYQNMSEEEQDAYREFLKPSVAGLTAADKSGYTKQGTEARRIIESSSRANKKIDQLAEIPESQFDTIDRIKGFLASFDNPLISALGTATMSPEKQELYRVTIPLALEDLRKLGGSDTEAEYQRIAKQYPQFLMDYKQFQHALASMREAINTDNANAREALDEANRFLKQDRQPYSTSTLPEGIAAPKPKTAAEMSDDELLSKYPGGS